MISKTIIQSKKLYGMPLGLFGICFLGVFFAVQQNGFNNNIGTAIAIAISLGVLLDIIGEKIPIWNTYIGGGAMLAYFGSGLLNYYGFIPQKTVDLMIFLIDKINFLEFYISILIVGSVLGISRKLLIKSSFGYIPAILIGLIFSFIFGGIAGFVTGIPFKEVALKYVLPIMGGGNGGGAIPMSEMYASVTGKSSGEYYAFAISILTMGNIFAILFGGVLNKLGKTFPKLSGEGKLLKNEDSLKNTIIKEESNSNITPASLGAALFLIVALYVIATFVGKSILPKIFGIQMHRFVYLILLAISFNLLNLIPSDIRESAKKISSFGANQLLPIIMVGVGIAYTDIGDLIATLTFTNLFISAFIVIGAVVGTMIAAKLVNFYPIETAITAGLCMANRSSSGDIAVMTAANRMELFPYSQISTRIGGAIALMFASILFGFWG